jgi:hypothetical protein
VDLPLGCEGMPPVRRDGRLENRREELPRHWLIFPSVRNHIPRNLHAPGEVMVGHEQEGRFPIRDGASQDVAVHRRRVVFIAVSVLETVLAACWGQNVRTQVKAEK